MNNFSQTFPESLILFEKKDDDKSYIKELFTYNVSSNISFIKKFYMVNTIVYIFFDTGENEIPDWQYGAIYDNFNADSFENHNLKIDFIDDEYNPTWLVKTSFIDDYNKMNEKIQSICELIEIEIINSIKISSELESEYFEIE